MLVVRQVFQAKYGRGDELVALFQELNGRMREVGSVGELAPQFRILTDVSGPFFTVVTEVEVGEWFERMMPLVESGSREFYTIVE
jgi:hypothetical protein